MERMNRMRGIAAQTRTAAPQSLSVRGSAAVIALTSVLLWAGIIWMIS